MKEIIKAMPAHRNLRRIMGVPASITNRVRAKPSESSLFFVLWSQNRHVWGIGDMPRDHSALGVSCLNAKSSEERVVYKRLNSTGTLIQRTTTEAPQGTYVLHRAGCSQEDDQLLRQGCERPSSPGRKSWSNTL